MQFCHEELVSALEVRDVAVTLSKTTQPPEFNCFGVADRYGYYRTMGPDWNQRHIEY